MEERGELKTERKQLDVRADRFDDFVASFLGDLEKKFGIDIELNRRRLMPAYKPEDSEGIQREAIKLCNNSAISALARIGARVAFCCIFLRLLTMGR